MFEYKYSVLNRVYDLYILFKHRQGTQCTYDVTVRGVRETAVAVEMQQVLHVCVCVHARIGEKVEVDGWVHGRWRLLLRV